MFTNTGIYICKFPFKNVIFLTIVRVQNVQVPENSSKTSLLGCISKQA